MKEKTKTKFKLASHDSMTYLPPKKWYLYPFRFMARCQSKTLQQQYEDYGIRMFDIRISFDKNGKPEFRHGLIAYKGDVAEHFKYLNSKKRVAVRLILEEYMDDKSDIQEDNFIDYCSHLESTYKNIKFFGGIRKRDWKTIYNFKYNPSYDNKYSSNNTNDTTGTILDDWFPWIYAKFNNKKNIEKGTDKPWLFIDFVNIR